jgi:hypothetical protein
LQHLFRAQRRGAPTGSPKEGDHPEFVRDGLLQTDSGQRQVRDFSKRFAQMRSVAVAARVTLSTPRRGRNASGCNCGDIGEMGIREDLFKGCRKIKFDARARREFACRIRVLVKVVTVVLANVTSYRLATDASRANIFLYDATGRRHRVAVGLAARYLMK